MKYFDTLKTVSEIKGHYRRLAQKYHPDRGGDTATMQEINGQYHEALKACNGERTTDNGKDHVYTYDADLEAGVVEQIARYLACNLPLDCALIGTWLWVSGDTKPWKDQLKALGFKWHATRCVWFWHEGKYKGRRSRVGLDGLAMRYGYSAVKQGKSTRLASLE
jgi:hypothetical protein